ncbi:MAG: succinate dehydrogenase cytochrome b subunit [Bacteroidota bacterium]
MSSLPSIFTSTIGRKLIMGLTGLFLVSFLLVHLSGNVLLFKSDGGTAFNQYTRFMTTNTIIRIMEWVLFAGFIVHIIYAAVLTSQNQKARPQGYAFKQRNSSNSSWFSRNMGLTGSIVLLFLVVHLTMFWGKYKFGDSTHEVSLVQAYEESWKVKEGITVGGVSFEPNHYVDFEELSKLDPSLQTQTKVQAISMTEVVKASFSQWYIVLFYVISMVLIAFHLNHGFQSGFRTLGLVHPKYTPLVSKIGTAFAVVVPLIFGLMPIYYFFVN